MPIFFVEKTLEAFAVQKLLSFFSTKNISVFGVLCSLSLIVYIIGSGQVNDLLGGNKTLPPP